MNRDRGEASDFARRGRAATLKRLLGPASPAERLAAIAEVRAEEEPELVDALESIAVSVDEDPVVRAAAIARLAAAGRSVELESRPPPAVRSAARKASDVAATRELAEAAERGDPSVRLPRAKPMPAEGVGLAIEVDPLPGKERRRVVAAGGRPGAAIGEVLGLRCEGNELAIVTHPDQLDPARLVEAPARPARVAVHHTDEEDVWTVPFEVVTVPDGRGGIRVAVLDERGRPRLTGTARADEGEVVFEVHAAERPGAVPVTLRGRASSGGLVVEDARAGVRSAAARRPMAAHPSDRE